MLEISCVITASFEWAAAVVPATPLVNPVKLVAVLPVYEMTSLPIRIKPLSSKSSVESTVIVVAVAFTAVLTSVVLFDNPRFMPIRLSENKRKCEK